MSKLRTLYTAFRAIRLHVLRPGPEALVTHTAAGSEPIGEIQRVSQLFSDR